MGGSAACVGAVGVVVESEPCGQPVEGHVAGADVEGEAPPVGAVGDVGDASEVEAGVVLSEEEFVADGHERGALAAEGDVEGAEVAHHGQPCFGGDGFAVAYLGGEAAAAVRGGGAAQGLVEDGVAVGGDGFDGYVLLLKEAIDYLAIEVSQFNVCFSIFQRGGVLQGGKPAAPGVGIGHGGGREDVGGVVGEVAEGQVNTVERGARHQAKDNHKLLSNGKIRESQMYSS